MAKAGCRRRLRRVSTTTQASAIRLRTVDESTVQDVYTPMKRANAASSRTRDARFLMCDSVFMGRSLDISLDGGQKKAPEGA